MTLARTRLRPAPARLRRGFTLVELVINVVIIGMLAAIAVPRFSQAATAAEAKSLAMTLTLVRNAVELYSAEHGRYPGYDPAAGSPDGTWFVNQLTQYSDAQGHVSNTLTYPFIYGPYIRAPFPTNPINDLNTVIVRAAGRDFVAPDSSGWKVVLSTGHFAANTGNERLAEIGVIDGAAAIPAAAEEAAPLPLGG